MNTTTKNLLRYRDLEQMGFGSRTTIYRAVKNNTFPKPMDDGRGRPVWLRDAIESWVESLAQAAA